jgi:hypothetical protein
VFAQQSEDLRLHGDVERGRGLVGDEQARAVDDGHGDEDALALAAGELVRVVAHAALGVGEADLVHGFEHALADLGARRGGMVGADGLGDLFADGMTGLSAVIGSWKIMAISRPRWRRIDFG